MLKKHFLRLMVLCTIFALGIVAPLSSVVFAETQFEAKKFPVESMYFEIAPEYSQPEDWPSDEPSMILFQRVTIKNMTGSKYDGPIEVLVPASEKNFQVLSVGEFAANADNNADMKPLEYKLDSEKGIVSFTPSSPIEKQASFSYGVSIICNPFKVDGAKKSIEVVYKAQADVGEFDAVIYAPINAKNPKVDPKPDKQEEVSKETVFSYHIHDIKAGDEKVFKLTYEKEGHQTTAQYIDENGAPTGGAATSKTPTSALDTTAALIIGGAILLFAIILFFGIRGKKANQVNTRQQRRNEARKQQTDAGKAYQSAAVKKKVLRKLLLDGEITEEEFAEEMKNL